MNKKGILISILLIIVFIIAACSKKSNLTYGPTPAVGTGTIDFSGQIPEIRIDNIIAKVGTEIDYTSYLEILNAEELNDLEIRVNASKVRLNEPGTYDVIYSFTYGNQVFGKQISVTLTEDEKYIDKVIKNTVEPSRDTPKANNPNGGNVAQPTTNTLAEKATTRTNTGGNTGIKIDVETSAPNQGNQNQNQNQNQGNQKQNQTPAQPVTAPPATNATSKQGVQNAVIELLSGEKISIQITPNFYIVSTRTDTTEFVRNGALYEIARLIVTFNNGQEQVLETVERRIG